MIRAAAGRPDLEVELLATSTFAFAAQVAARYRAGRVVLVGDAAHRMTPRGGRGMNTAIADGHDLGWRLAWIVTGRAGAALLDTYEAERAPIGRRNVEMSMVPGGGGTDDGLLEDLGPIVASAAIVPETGTPGHGSDAGCRRRRTCPAPDPAPGPRTSGSTSTASGARRSTSSATTSCCSWPGRGGPGRRPWTRPARVASCGSWASRRPSSPRRTAWRPAGRSSSGPTAIVAWRAATAPADRVAALAAAVAAITGRNAARSIPQAA